MKKTILTLALAILTLSGANVMAQSVSAQQNDKTEQCAKKGKCDKAKKDKCDKKDCKKGEKGNKPGRKGPKAPKGDNLMQGITLTTEQQQKIDKIKADTKSEFAKIKEDTQKDRDKVMEKSRKEIEKVLTKEQRVQYESNLKMMKERQQLKKEGGKMKADMRKMERRGVAALDTAGAKTKRVYNKAIDKGENSFRNAKKDGQKMMKRVDASFKVLKGENQAK